jgi:amino acid adenylation domain-containing protein
VVAIGSLGRTGAPGLHELIENQARRTPDAPALAFEGRRLTYAELERRALALAGELARRGAGPDVRVGLLVERSAEMVVAMLAILKAGAAYVPMDTSFPPERIAYMLSDSGATLVLTQRTLIEKFPSTETKMVLLDEFDWEGRSISLQGNGAKPENLAYVIYTSGSTGRPKGVAIEHRNIVSYVLDVAERLRLEPGMTYATVSTVAADLGNTVIFPALATGGCLHVLSQERAESPAQLCEYFSRERIDVLKIVPSHLAALQSGSNPEQAMPARRLILGGEASRLDWIEKLRRLAPQCEIFNHYGPTETTVGVLTCRVGEELPRTQSGTLPLGRPLPGASVYLVDEQGRPVPPGEKGELWIGGRGVGRGYLNRPELTAERFVRNPFSTEAGARLYRTGDLARGLPEGAIEFCGRIDHQVKIRGYRVELGEIEGVLREHASVREAAVLARDEPSGEKKLYACYAGGATVAALREHLKQRLPSYMVPSAFLQMDRLPLNANGKLDRQALAALPLESPQPERAGAGARTETEKTLLEIWSELLGVPALGVDDDVFDLGAHSLMAMKALAQIRERFDVNLALRNLFEQPTVAGLGGIIDGLALAAPKRAAPGGGGREELVL